MTIDATLLTLHLAASARLEPRSGGFILYVEGRQVSLAGQRLIALRDGVTMDALVDGLGLEQAAQVHHVLGRLAAWGALEARLDNVARLTRAPPALIWSSPPQEAVRLSRLALLRRYGDVFIVEGEAAGPRLQSADSVLFDVVQALRTPRTADTLGVPAASVWLKMLHAMGALERDSLESDGRRSWEFHDWMMHTRSRGGAVRRPMGGTWRFEGAAMRRTPETRSSWGGPTVSLPSPAETADERFVDVLFQRRSTRTWSMAPVPLDALGAMLHQSMRVHEGGRRTIPSGGGRYPLELYLIVRRCEGLSPGMYHYRSDEHAVVRLPVEAERLAASTWSGDAPMILIITARAGRTAQKYEAIAYSLILKEVGGLIQTLYLTATANRLAVCAIGTGNNDHFAAATGLDPFVEVPVGELIVGRPAS
ncbi:MAG: SagB/ThcOx family dehydrogenase [Myxococcota bacterium]